MVAQDAMALISAARRPSRSLPLCLRGDLQARWDDLERQLDTATKVGAGSLGGDGRVQIAREMEQLRAEMEEHTLTVVVQALPHLDYRKLEQQHPPRKAPTKAPKAPRDDADDEQVASYQAALAVHEEATAGAQQDKLAGVNTSSFYLALIRACLVEPDLDDDAVDALLAVLTNRQFDELAGLALTINRGEVSVPFSPTASRLARSSSES